MDHSKIYFRLTIGISHFHVGLLELEGKDDTAQGTNFKQTTRAFFRPKRGLLMARQFGKLRSQHLGNLVTIHRITLTETNIAPENRPLEKEIPIGNHHF